MINAHSERCPIGGEAFKRAAASSSVRTNGGISGQLYSSEIIKVVGVYVESATHQRALKILSEKNILILPGDADVGKRSAAIRLLESFHHETIFEIAPTLEDLTAFDCQTRQGYLWNTPPGEKVARLSRYALDQLSREHKEQESHLIITLTNGVRLSAEVTRGYLVEWNDCPACVAVLSKHLAWHLKDESEEVRAKAAELRQQPEINALVNDKMQYPAQAARLAELLVQVAREELSLEDLLAEFDELNRQDAQIWFERHSQLQQRLQMVALAVLNGSDFRKIIEAGKELRSFLNADESSDPGKAAAIVEAELTTSIKQWLSEFEARIVIQEISAEFGPNRVEAVVFKKPQFQSAVLAYVWQELPYWRTPLFNWLVEMGSSGDFRDRIAAAVALGELSQYHAFEDVLRNAVGLWAKADDPSQRRLAAFILMLQAIGKDLSAPVLGLLHHWAKTDGNWRLQWTAATAYGTELGLAYPQLALRDLREVFLSPNLVLHVTVLNTLRYLFESGRQYPQMFTVVLRTLESWSRDEKLMTQNVLFIFRELLKSQIRVEGHSWPTILWLAYLDKTSELQFRALISSSLKDNEIRSLLLDDLRDWLVDADQNQGIYKLLGRVLFSLFKMPEPGLNVVRRIISDQLRQWHASGQSQSAGRMLTALKEHFSL